MDTSDLAKRMKDYESISKTKLMKRCPVICRIDGKSHHNFTRGFKRPFDEVYIKSMQETAKYLCENLQGVVMSYQQSDEISLVFVDYKELNTSPYFDYEIQKMCSIIASMATMAFNKFFKKEVDNLFYRPGGELTFNEFADYREILVKATEKGAMFDARVFNIPKEEVCNNILWRQNDATRNSIEMVGRAYFSHKELHKKSCNDIQDMLMTQHGVNWNDLPTYLKRGSCCIKRMTDNMFGRNAWFVDKEIPIFKGKGRKYIDDLIFIGEE